MGLYTKKFFSKKLKNYVENCNTCRGPAKMYSTGYAFKRKSEKFIWGLEFKCEVCNDLGKITCDEYNELVLKIIKEDNPKIEDI